MFWSFFSIFLSRSLVLSSALEAHSFTSEAASLFESSPALTSSSTNSLAFSCAPSPASIAFLMISETVMATSLKWWNSIHSISDFRNRGPAAPVLNALFFLNVSKRAGKHACLTDRATAVVISRGCPLRRGGPQAPRRAFRGPSHRPGQGRVFLRPCRRGARQVPL